MDDVIFINIPLIKYITTRVNNLYYSVINPEKKLQHNLDNIIEGIIRICITGTQTKFSEYKNILESVL